MSIRTALDYWNTPPDADTVHVITHSRKNFYGGADITWYEFSVDGMSLHELGHENILPEGFLRVTDTNYYEFGGDKKSAIKKLTASGFTLIVRGDDI